MSCVFLWPTARKLFQFYVRHAQTRLGNHGNSSPPRSKATDIRIIELTEAFVRPCVHRSSKLHFASQVGKMSSGTRLFLGLASSVLISQ